VIASWLEPNKEGHRTYKTIYQVITNDVNDGPITAMSAGGLPVAGGVYVYGNDSDSWAFCHAIPEVKLKEYDESRKQWHLTYTHSTEPMERCQTTSIENPLMEPWAVEGDSDEWTEEATTDKDDEAIDNSSLEPLTGKEIEVFKTRRRLRLSKNLASLNQDLIDDIEGSVNDGNVTIFGKAYGARQLYMRKIRFTRRIYATCTFYYPHEFYIDTKQATHDLKVIDRGFKEYTGTDPTDPKHYTPIREPDGDEGEVVREPVYLKDGQRLPAGNDPEELEFRYYPEEDWSGLGFPT